MAAPFRRPRTTPGVGSQPPNAAVPAGGGTSLRTGILGGAFNPPHLGHLVCAQEAHSQLGLDAVMLVPVGEAPHRTVEDDPGPAARLDLCARAVAGDDRLTVSPIEVERGGLSYTVETLRALRQRDPAAEFVLILGADQAASLPEWREPEAVLALAHVAVASRAGMEREAVLRRLEGLPGVERIDFFEMPRIDISSSLVRSRAASGRPIRYLVPDSVAEAIDARGLYRPATPAQAGAE